MKLPFFNKSSLCVFLTIASSWLSSSESQGHMHEQVQSALQESKDKQEKEKLQFFAYSEEVENHINKDCPLCTPIDSYQATIAFTKHWKITYWKNQAYLGRSLLIPNRHFGSFEEMNDEEAWEYREILKQVLPALQKAFGSTHFNVAYLMNQAYRKENPDPVAIDGKPNPHFHWHILPRYDGTREFCGEIFEDPDFGDVYNMKRKQYLEGEFQKQAIAAIRSHLDIVYLPVPQAKN